MIKVKIARLKIVVSNVWKVTFGRGVEVASRCFFIAI